MWDAASAESQSRLPIKATCVSWGVHNTRAVFALLCFKRKKNSNLELKDVYANEHKASCWRSGNLCSRISNATLEKVQDWHRRLRISSAEATRKKQPRVESAALAAVLELPFLCRDPPMAHL